MEGLPSLLSPQTGRFPFHVIFSRALETKLIFQYEFYSCSATPMKNILRLYQRRRRHSLVKVNPHPSLSSLHSTQARSSHFFSFPIVYSYFSPPNIINRVNWKFSSILSRIYDSNLLCRWHDIDFDSNHVCLCNIRYRRKKKITPDYKNLSIKVKPISIRRCTSSKKRNTNRKIGKTRRPGDIRTFKTRSTVKYQNKADIFHRMTFIPYV